jgi:hypothetical protein
MNYLRFGSNNIVLATIETLIRYEHICRLLLVLPYYCLTQFPLSGQISCLFIVSSSKTTNTTRVHKVQDV